MKIEKRWNSFIKKGESPVICNLKKKKSKTKPVKFCLKKGEPPSNFKNFY